MRDGNGPATIKGNNMSDQAIHKSQQSSGDQTASPVRQPRDLPKWLTWYVVPGMGLAILFLLLLELVFGIEAMRSGFYPQRDGLTLTWYELITFKEGPMEYTGVLLMVPGILAGLYAALKFKRFPDRRLGVWALICALGLIYYGGEELSWGDHFRVSMGWKERQSISESALGLNEQGETNIHNLDNIVGKTLGRNSKNIVELWCYIGALAIPLVLARRKPPLSVSERGYWFWPTTATVVCAVLVFVTYRPVRVFVKLVEYDQEPYWARQSELQEFFMAAALSIYVCSIAWRLRQVPDVPSAA